MMKAKKTSTVILCLVFSACTAWVWAGDRPASRRAMSFLQLGAGPRAYAMGEAFSGLADDVTALSWNPAGLAKLSDPQIFFMHNQWIANLRQEFLAGTYPLFSGQIGAQMTYLNSDIQLRRDEDGLLVGEGFNPYSLRGGLAYARALPWGLAAGGGVNYAREQLDDVAYQTVFVDAGGSWNPPGQWWTLGAAVQNLGLPVAGYPLPLTLRLGAAASFFSDSLNVTAEVARTIPGWFRYSLGAEFWYRNLFAVRAGYIHRPEREGLDLLSGLRTGLGFNIQGYQLDYALIPQGDLGFGHRASFTYFFGGGRALASEKEELITKARQSGARALAEKKYEAAVDQFQKVLSFSSEDPEAKKGLALAQQALRQQERSQELEQRFTKAEKFYQQEQWEDALDEYRRILLIDDGNARATAALAETQKRFYSGEITKHLSAGREAFKRNQWADALLAWQAVLALDDKHAEARDMLAKTRTEMAKGGKGFKDPRIQEWYLEGLALFEKGEYYSAMQKWEQVLKIAPKHQQAKKYLGEARRLLEEKVAALLQAGDRYLQDGDLVRAAGSWRRVLKISPRHAKAAAKIKAQEQAFQERAKALYLKGIEDYTQALYKQAIANWQDVLTLVPDHSRAKENIKKAEDKIKAVQ